jgi:hypothetical protein
MLAESVRVFANRYGVLPGRRIVFATTRPVVVGKDQGPLVRAAGQHHLAGPHLPEPLARGLPAARRQVSGSPRP